MICVQTKKKWVTVIIYNYKTLLNNLLTISMTDSSMKTHILSSENMFCYTSAFKADQSNCSVMRLLLNSVCLFQGDLILNNRALKG